MSKESRKVVIESLKWLALGLFLALGVIGGSIYFLARNYLFMPRKTVVLQMKWQRGDAHYGANAIHLESGCLSNADASCFCSLDFKSTNSKEFADYIESFRGGTVPTSFKVDYNSKRGVTGALLEKVGDWPAERFAGNDKALGTGSRMSKGNFHTFNVRNPGDCFPNFLQ